MPPPSPPTQTQPRPHRAPRAWPPLVYIRGALQITAGVHSTGGNHTYPFQLQIALDREYGWGEYSVTNLGACGSTMLKGADSPFWKRPQYQTLINNTWDIVTISEPPTNQKPHFHLFSSGQKLYMIDYYYVCQLFWGGFGEDIQD